MKSTLFPKQLNFTEFGSASISEWGELIKKDLNGKEYSALESAFLEGVSLLPFYMKDALDSLDYDPATVSNLRASLTNRWKIIDWIGSADSQSIAEASKAIESGTADGCFISAHINENSLLEFEKIPLSAECHTVNDFSQNKTRNPGSFGVDVFASAVANGKKINEECVSELINQALVASKEYSQKRLIIDGRFWQNSSGEIVTELLLGLAALNELFEFGKNSGHSENTLLNATQFRLGIGTDFLMEVVKIRAFRLLVLKLLQARNASAENFPVSIHSIAGLQTVMGLDIYSNLLRSTTAGMSAAIGGADAITLLPFDSLTAGYNPFSARLSRNLHYLLMEESYLAQVKDAVAGAYFFEKATERLCETVWQFFLEIEQAGGLIQSIHKGEIQKKIWRQQSIRKDLIAYKKKTLIGVNSYSNTLETPNPGTLNTSISYSPYYPAQCLSENAADTIPSVAVLRESIEFEKIRCKLEDFVGKSGKRPVIQLLPLGDKRMRQARASFAYNFLNCGGYDVRSHNGFDSFDNALDFVNEWNPDAVVFCSSDAEYGELTSFWKSKAAILKNIPLVLLAGNPGELSETYKNNGVSLFIHLKSNLVETLSALHQHFGIKL